MVNDDARYVLPALQAPPTSGWLHLAASVAPPVGPPFVRRNATRSALLSRLTRIADGVRRIPGVEQASVFRAVLMPPIGAGAGRPARFDVAVLVRTRTPEGAVEIRDAAPVEQMLSAIGDVAADVVTMAARCARSVGPVDHSRQGLFLFNHFAADADAPATPDVETAIELWERLAAWYVAETGLTNSTLLRPIGPCDYLFVNHARWNVGLARFTAAQFGKRSFRTFVRANLAANRIVAMPVLYRLA